MRVISTTRRLAATTMLASAVGCAPSGGASQPAAPRPTTLVEVTNTSWLDVVVYSVAAGPRLRLGMVRSMDTQTFRIPQHNVTGSGLRLLADPVGSPEVFVSDRIVLSPGQRVQLTVAPALRQSYFAVRW